MNPSIICDTYKKGHSTTDEFLPKRTRLVLRVSSKPFMELTRNKVTNKAWMHDITAWITSAAKAHLFGSMTTKQIERQVFSNVTKRGWCEGFRQALQIDTKTMSIKAAVKKNANLPERPVLLQEIFELSNAKILPKTLRALKKIITHTITNKDLANVDPRKKQFIKKLVMFCKKHHLHKVNDSKLAKLAQEFFRKVFGFTPMIIDTATKAKRARSLFKKLEPIADKIRGGKEPRPVKKIHSHNAHKLVKKLERVRHKLPIKGIDLHMPEHVNQLYYENGKQYIFDINFGLAKMNKNYSRNDLEKTLSKFGCYEVQMH